MIAYIPILFALVGLLLYALVSNGKIAEIGRLMFATAFLVVMFTFAHDVLRIGR